MLVSLIILLITTAMSVVLLFVLTALIHSKAAGVREWTQGIGIAVIALLLIAARGKIPGILSIEVANGLLLVNMGLIYAGFRRHLAQPVARLPLVLGGVLAFAAGVYYHYLRDSVAMLTITVSAYHSVLCFAIVASIPTTSDPHLRHPFLFTRVAAFALGVAHALRGAFFALQTAVPSLPFDIASWNMVFLACGSLALPALTLGAVMMANGQVRREAAYAADHDLPTGAWSERAFIAFAERAHDLAARRYKALSLLMLEADHVRRIDITHGQASGERVLREIVMRTQGVIREVDCCARLGGERFGVLLPDATHETALELAARLRTALDGALPPGPSGVPLAYTVSIGIATLALGESLAGLMGRAEAALGAAKAGGHNRVVSAPLPPRVEHAGEWV